MIALPHHMPFVKIGDSNLISYQPEWLEQKVLDASVDSNVPSFVTSCVTDGISRYLSNSFQGTVIGSDELHEKVVELLDGLGLEDVSKKLDRTPPPITVNLARMAKKAGKTGECGFFTLLEEKCHEVLRSGSNTLIVTGMEECLKVLSNTQRLDSTQEQLKQEIENRLNEIRTIGELSMPVFNVMVSQ